jgi:hypothetical protein
VVEQGEGKAQLPSHVVKGIEVHQAAGADRTELHAVKGIRPDAQVLDPAMHLSQELQVLGEIIWELDLPQCRQEPAMRFRKAPHTHEAEDGYSG